MSDDSDDETKVSTCQGKVRKATAFTKALRHTLSAMPIRLNLFVHASDDDKDDEFNDMHDATDDEHSHRIRLTNDLILRRISSITSASVRNQRSTSRMPIAAPYTTSIPWRIAFATMITTGRPSLQRYSPRTRQLTGPIQQRNLLRESLRSQDIQWQENYLHASDSLA